MFSGTWAGPLDSTADQYNSLAGSIELDKTLVWFLVGNGGMGYWDYYRGTRDISQGKEKPP